MSNRKKKRRTRPQSSRRPVPPPPPSRWARWRKAATSGFGRLRTVYKVILGAGGLAGAVAAILAVVHLLLPPPAVENSAQFTSAEAISAMSLSQYAQTSQTVYLQSASNRRTAARLLSVTSTEESTPSSTPGSASSAPESPSQSPSASPSPTASVSASGSASPSAPGATRSVNASLAPCASSSAATLPASATPSSCAASPSATKTGPAAIRNNFKALTPVGMSQAAAAAYANKVTLRILKLDPHLQGALCSDPSATCHELHERLVRDTGCTQSSGVEPSVAACAEKAAGLLDRDTRTTGTHSHANSKGQSQPVGEFVTADLELKGLKGQPVTLSWSIFAQDSADQLPSQWEGHFVVYRLVATTDDDSGTVALWVPLPRQHGPYVVRLTLSLGSADLAGVETGPFS
jgi:hypothetical protein